MRTITRKVTAVAGGVGLAVGGAVIATGPAEAASCYAKNGHLYCDNAKSPVMLHPRYEVPPGGRPEKVVDTLLSTHSYFKCYVYGEPHSGGNNVWYKTYGDKTGRWGYVAAKQVYTWKDPFPGVKKC